MYLAIFNLVEDYSNGNRLNLIEQSNLGDEQIKKAPGILDYLKLEI